jgi:flagellar protein FlaG
MKKVSRWAGLAGSPVKKIEGWPVNRLQGRRSNDMDVGVIKSINLAVEGQQTRFQPADVVDRQRRDSALALTENTQNEKKVNPEEILEKIKEISDNGKYSVRFEKHDELQEFIVKVVDSETEEVVRQLPPEEILGLKAFMQELSGNVLDFEG